MALWTMENPRPELNFNLVTVDSGLLLKQESKDRVIKTLNRLDSIRLGFLVHGDNKEERNASESLVKALGLHTSKILEVKDRSSQADAILGMALGKGKASLPAKLAAGKHILHLGERRSGFISTFNPPKDLACHKFHKVVWATECPYDCAYCYLQLTFRMVPYIRQYLNLEDLFTEINKIDSLGKQVVLNSGELADSLAVDNITQIASEVINAVLRTRNVQLLLLTKSSNIDHLPDIDNDKVILAASITTPYNAATFEPGTANPYDRIEGLSKAQEKGYRIRCRIDPIITHAEDWEGDYCKVIKYLFDAVKPEVITIGQPRFYPILLQFIKRRNQEVGEFFENCAGVSAGERQRTEFRERAEVYRKIAHMIEKHGGSVTIAPCKEEPKMLKELGLNLRKCNCII
ncbi:MAG: hypothetical protein M0021_15110 [Clostridia bacterium]|nr:hypothetical protein [Clostridia bacterium]